MPARILHIIDTDELFLYSKREKLFGLDYSDELSWHGSIKNLLDVIPSFLDNQEHDSFLDNDCFKISNHQISKLYELIYLTQSSNHAFFYKTIKKTKSFISLTILFVIYIQLSFKLKKDISPSLKLANLSFRIRKFDTMILMFGPVDIKEDFLDEDSKLEYIKNLKSYFSLKQHTYDLANLFNQRESTMVSDFNTKVDNFMRSFKFVFYFDSQKQYPKKTLRYLACFLIELSKYNRKKAKDITYEIFEEFYKHKKYEQILAKIKSSKIAREFESIELFNNLTFKHSEFDEFTLNAMGFLNKKLQADTYVFSRYYQYNDTFKLEAQSNINTKYKANMERVLQKLEKDSSLIETTLSKQMVTGYYQDKKPTNIIDDLQKHNTLQIFDNNPTVHSVLSIPLIFDNRIFAIIHFLGFSKYQFDDIDQRFLLKHAPIISRRYIENIFDENLEHITKLLDGFESKISNQKSIDKRIHQICEDITKIFSCDGVCLWVNKKEVFHTQKELDEATLAASINFLDDGEEDNYAFDTNGNECLFCNYQDRDIIVINSIKEQCSIEDDGSRYMMAYKDKFLQKGINSLVSVPIKNYHGKLTGTLVIFDKHTREYGLQTKNMMHRVSLHLGAILNTISSIRYQTQQNDERSLHESSQYLNMIDSRAKDLEQRLQKVNFPNRHDKHGIFLNIEDIKDYSLYTKSFLFRLFQHGKFTKRYDALLDKDITNVQKCKNFILLKNIANQILISNEKRMNLQRDIIYHNKLISKIEVKIPKQELHNVLSNIVNNAIKYGKETSYIKLTEDINEHYYNLYVENIGLMIHNDEYEKIFAKGYRGRIIYDNHNDNAEFAESASQNKGVGLYYAKQISKAWQGNVKLHASNQIGNTGYAKNIFIIKIPIKKVKEYR